MKNLIHSIPMWLRGGIVGALTPPILFAGIFIPVIVTPAVIALGFLEILPVAIGDALGLPIRTPGVAFIIYNLNALGFALVVGFWAIVGLFVGLAMDLRKSKNGATSESSH